MVLLPELLGRSAPLDTPPQRKAVVAWTVTRVKAGAAAARAAQL
jgi:hypothetical protein